MDRNELVLIAVVFFEPAKVLTDKFEEKLVFSELLYFPVALQLFKLGFLRHDEIGNLSQAVLELLKGEALTRVVVCLDF